MVATLLPLFSHTQNIVCKTSNVTNLNLKNKILSLIILLNIENLGNIVNYSERLFNRWNYVLSTDMSQFLNSNSNVSGHVSIK